MPAEGLQAPFRLPRRERTSSPSDSEFRLDPELRKRIDSRPLALLHSPQR